MTGRKLAAAIKYTDKTLAKMDVTRRFVWQFWREHTPEGQAAHQRGEGTTDVRSQTWKDSEWFIKTIVVDVQRFLFSDVGDAAMGIMPQAATPAEMDGKFGSMTYRRLLTYLESVDPDKMPVEWEEGLDPMDHMMWAGNKIPIKGVSVSSLDEPGAFSFPKTVRKGYGKWKGKIVDEILNRNVRHLATVHWDGTLSPKVTFKVLSRRGYSSTFCIGNPDRETGIVTVHEWLDPGRNRGFHGGSKANAASLLSFDMCNAVYLKYQPRYIDMCGKPRPIIRYIAHSTRRRKYILGLYEDQILALLRVLKTFSDASGLPFVFPTRDNTDVECGSHLPIYTKIPNLFDKDQSFVHNHLHLTKKKFDVAGLEDQIIVLLTQKPEYMLEFPELVTNFRLHDDGWGAWVDALRHDHYWVWPEIGWDKPGQA